MTDPRMHPNGLRVFREDVLSAEPAALALGLAIGLRTVAQTLVDQSEDPHTMIDALAKQADGLAAALLPDDLDLRMKVRAVILSAFRLAPD